MSPKHIITVVIINKADLYINYQMEDFQGVHTYCIVKKRLNMSPKHNTNSVNIDKVHIYIYAMEDFQSVHKNSKVNKIEYESKTYLQKC